MATPTYSPEAVAAVEAGIRVYEEMQAEGMFQAFVAKVAERPEWDALIRHDLQVVVLLRLAFDTGVAHEQAQSLA